MHISVTAMATTSVATALSVATTFAVMCTSCNTKVNIAVTALSATTTTTLVCTAMLQRCHCHRCCSVVSLHRRHTNVAAIAATVLSGPLLSQHS